MDISQPIFFGDALQTFRKRAKMTQQELAKQIGVATNTIGSWERGNYIPASKTMLYEIERVLRLTDEETKLLLALWLWPGFVLEDGHQWSVDELNALVRVRIVEDPLTVSNLNTIISALTELSTKYWLIAKGRFADLIEYTQTHNEQFAEEAQVVVMRITHNSPMNMDWKVDLSAPSVAEALVTTIDGITQVRQRLAQAELENQSKAQEIRLVEQRADHEQQMAALEREKQLLEVEQHRLEVLEKRLEVQKKGIEYALEIAEKVIDTLHPGADAATRAMEIQALLPNLIQLQNGKGLELALPAQRKSEDNQMDEKKDFPPTSITGANY